MSTATLPEKKPHMIAVYKPGHPWEGIHVERGRECGCGRWFPQQVISGAWLKELTPARRQGFLESCEIERFSQTKTAAWFPKRCHRCERRSLESRAAIS